MTKKVINDITPPRKSIRQIPILANKRKGIAREKTESVDEDDNFSVVYARRVVGWQRKPLNPKFVIWTIAIICLLALFFGISIIFSSATVVITPRTQVISFTNDLYIAKSESSNSADLFFEVLNIKQSSGETVTATEEKEVSQKASGKIIIYNNYNTAPQRLINNTRFEANNGKIYRINSSVIVPGLKKIDGKVVPGSVEATVYADQAGEEYNLKLSDLAGDFKIPGFKGDPRYASFYALLKTDIVGGLIGKQRIVSDDLRKATIEIIKSKLREQLLKEIYAVKPENYLIFKDGYSIDYVNLPDTPVGNDKVKINVEGNINGIIFNNTKLSKYIATKKIEGFDALPTELIPSDSLLTTFTAKDNTSLWKNKTIDIKFTGEATIKWLYDSEAIKNDLAGKKESEVKSLVSKYQNSVSTIKVIFKPIWTRYFPDNLDRIHLQEVAGLD